MLRRTSPGESTRTDITLSQFVRREMDRRGIISTYDLARVLDVSQGTAWRLVSSSRTPREATLIRIALAFDASLTEVREMACRPAGEPEPFYWPREFNQLTQRQRDAVLEIGWAFLDHRAAYDRAG